MAGIGRKRSETGGSSAGASQILKQVRSMFSGFNNAEKNTEEFADGVAGEFEDLLTLKMADAELVGLSDTWATEFGTYDKEIKIRQEKNYEYWKGQQYTSKSSTQRGTDNVIFEAIETLLPIISRQNPEPNIKADDTIEGQFLADSTAKILERKADETRLKSKVKTLSRQWCIYFLGCFKMGWDEAIDDMYFQIINPERLILDPKGEFDGAEFKGEYVGEYKTATAKELADTFPKFKDVITASVDGKMGTSIGYHEWWTNEYVFWRYRDIILDKRENPYWNGSEEKKAMNEFGVEEVVSNDGVNHFASPKMPYSFLTVFNTGKQPHDETSLIEQVISLQDIVNKRLKQIDKNADDTNNGWVFNNQFSEDQAKTALNALRNGGAIIATTESIAESVQRFPAPSLSPDIFNDMQDKREQIYNIMGVRGSTASGVMNEKTVRGKIEIKGQDVDRLSLVIEQIEQLVDHLYNLAVQTIYVYYDVNQAARALGPEDAQKYITTLKAGPSRRLVVSVKEGSTIPQDPLVRANQAIDLAGQKLMDPETMYERLAFPDAKEAALKLMNYTTNPQQYTADLGGAPVPPPAPPQTAPTAGLPPGVPPPPSGVPQVPATAGLTPMSF